MRVRQNPKTVQKGELAAEWATLAPAWIQATAGGENVNRDGLLDAWMLRAIGEVAGRDVIDLGCGEGRFCRMLTRRGARVVGIDLCQPFIEFAEAHRFGNERYLVADIEDLSALPSAGFDLAVSYLSLVDVADFAAVVQEAYRLLRAGGRFVVCNLQSMNTGIKTTGSPWLKDKEGRKLHFLLDDYLDEGPRAMPMFGHVVTNFHRTLSTYINSFLQTGFALEGLQEPTPSPAQLARYPELADNLRVPYFIIYLLRKA